MDSHAAVVALEVSIKNLQLQVRKGKAQLCQYVALGMLKLRMELLDERLTQHEQTLIDVAKHLSNIPKAMRINQTEGDQVQRPVYAIAAFVVGFVLAPTIAAISDEVVDLINPLEAVAACKVKDFTNFFHGREKLPNAIQTELEKYGIAADASEELVRVGIALAHPDILHECKHHGLKMAVIGRPAELIQSCQTLVDAENSAISDVLSELPSALEGIAVDTTEDSVASSPASLHIQHDTERDSVIQLQQAQHDECDSSDGLHKLISTVPMAVPLDTVLPTPFEEERSHDQALVSLTADTARTAAPLSSNPAEFPFHMAMKDSLGDISIVKERTKLVDDNIDANASMKMLITETYTTHEMLCGAQYAYLKGYRAVGDAIRARMTSPRV